MYCVDCLNEKVLIKETGQCLECYRKSLYTKLGLNYCNKCNKDNMLIADYVHDDLGEFKIFYNKNKRNIESYFKDCVKYEVLNFDIEFKYCPFCGRKINILGRDL